MTDKPDRVTESVVEHLRSFSSTAPRENDRAMILKAADLLEALTTRSQPGEDAVERNTLPLLFYDSDSRAFRLASLIAFLRGQAADGRMSVRNVALLADDLAALNAAALPVDALGPHAEWFDVRDGIATPLTPSEDK